MRRANNHCTNSALKKAIEAVQRCEMYPNTILPYKLKEAAEKGLPGDFPFNQWNIRYNTKNKYGIFSPQWLVSNGISGTQKVFYTKDYVGKTGKVLWRSLASDIRKV